MSKERPDTERRLDADRMKNIVEAAAELAMQLPEEQRIGFCQDYISVMTKLNLNLDVELEKFEAMAAPLVTALLPRCPTGVMKALDNHKEQVQSIASHLITTLSNIPSLGVRTLMVKTLHAALDLGLTTVNEHATCAETRGGVRLD